MTRDRTVTSIPSAAWEAVCLETASNASSTGNPAPINVASCRVTSARSVTDNEGWNH